MEGDLQWKRTFGGRGLLEEENPCMLPSLLCGIFHVTIVFRNLVIRDEGSVWHLHAESMIIWQAEILVT